MVLDFMKDPNAKHKPWSIAAMDATEKTLRGTGIAAFSGLGTYAFVAARRAAPGLRLQAARTATQRGPALIFAPFFAGVYGLYQGVQQVLLKNEFSFVWTYPITAALVFASLSVRQRFRFPSWALQVATRDAQLRLRAAGKPEDLPEITRGAIVNLAQPFVVTVVLGTVYEAVALNTKESRDIWERREKDIRGASTFPKS
ncbi:hypothetical protein DFH06DRAFT_1209913 [Mycena polygramma]|nr:hypothetical protein DFH06DRAFT_1209913 [Mycena polygramma]